MSEEGRRIARERSQNHREAGNYRPPIGAIDGVDADLVGIEGEIEFGRLFNEPVDTSWRERGDEGIDFHVWLMAADGIRRIPIDVKCFRKPRNLINEAKNTKSNVIYILAKYHDETESASLLGWEWGSVLMRSEPRFFVNSGALDHWVPAGELRSIDELLSRANPFRGRCECGVLGIYVVLEKWYCNNHRPVY